MFTKFYYHSDWYSHENTGNPNLQSYEDGTNYIQTFVHDPYTTSSNISSRFSSNSEAFAL